MKPTETGIASRARARFLAAITLISLGASLATAAAQSTTPAEDYARFQKRTGSNPFGKRSGDNLLSNRQYYWEHHYRYWSHGNRYRQTLSDTVLNRIEYVPTCFYRTEGKTIAYNFKPVYRPWHNRHRRDLIIEDVGPIPKYRLSQPAISVKTSGLDDRLSFGERNITRSRPASGGN
jgi:hypothetical protein